MGPFIKYCPIPNSKAIKGTPQIIKDRKYGIKKAPKKREENLQLLIYYIWVYINTKLSGHIRSDNFKKSRLLIGAKAIPIIINFVREISDLCIHLNFRSAIDIMCRVLIGSFTGKEYFSDLC